MRSAAPPTSQGTLRATAFSACPDALRVGMPFSSAGNCGNVAVPALRQLTPLHPLEIVRKLGVLDAVALEELLPVLSQRAPARADALGEVLHDSVGDQELRVLGPAIAALGEAHLLLAERLAVGLGRVLDAGGAVADVAVDDDQRRPLVLALEGVEGPTEHLEIVRVADV